MAAIYKDMVKQTVSAVASSGTGAFTLSTAVSGYQALAAGDDGGIGTFNATEGTKWQTFVGTYTSSGTSLARTIPIDGSAGAATNETFTTAAVVFMTEISHSVRNSAPAPGTIIGFNPQWTSTTVLGASSGVVYIESLNANIYGTPSDITPSSPSASTWYHVYVYSSDGTAKGTPTLEANTSAPVAFATPCGFARSKTSDASRRYLYSVKTDGSSHFYPFLCDQFGMFRWHAVDLGSAPFRCLSNGGAGTTVDLSGIVPTTSRMAYLFIQNLSAGTVYIDDASQTVSSTVFAADPSYVASNPPGPMVLIPTDSSQMVKYTATGTPGVYIDVIGFINQR
jgi:hypothetical protein